MCLQYAVYMSEVRPARPSGATVAQPICNRQVSGFESPLGLSPPPHDKGPPNYLVGPFVCSKIPFC